MEEQMKKLLTLVIAFAAVSMYSAAQAQEFICDAKVGGAYASDQKAGGFNSALEVGVGVNPYFELLAMPGFTWFNWDRGLGITKYEGPGLSSELKTTVNGYMFPVLAGAKIKIADAKESIGIVPYLTVGAGYTWMKYSYETPEFYLDATTKVEKSSGSSLYKGFTWLALAGFTYEFPGTNMSMVAEAGYRGAKLEKNSFEVDMSGFVANVGVSFAIGGETN
jgi:hypothetical protein